MSIWSRISDVIASISIGESLTALFERLRTPPERSVAFTIAVIALSAKMAKADGMVTRDEVHAFREVFHIPAEAIPQAARVFNLARQDVAGFDAYAKKIGRMFGHDSPVLVDLMDGLFHIAQADGVYHPREDAFLHEVARQFGLSERAFLAIRARYVNDIESDPYLVLGVDEGQSLSDIRTAWKELVRQNHPDQMFARGVPEEAIKLAEKRLVKINRAYEIIREQKSMTSELT